MAKSIERAVAGWVFVDANGDGFRQDTEQTGVSGVPVVLRQGAATLRQINTVGTDGWYAFDEVATGDYCVDVARSPRPG